MQTPVRNRLSSENLHSLMYLRSNLRLQQKRKDPKFAEKVAQWVATSGLDDESLQHVEESEPVAVTTSSQALVVVDE